MYKIVPKALKQREIMIKYRLIRGLSCSFLSSDTHQKGRCLSTPTPVVLVPRSSFPHNVHVLTRYSKIGEMSSLALMLGWSRVIDSLVGGKNRNMSCSVGVLQTS